MKRQKGRAIVAAEHPDVQYFLREVVEQWGDIATVGQARNAPEALILARNLRPDVAIVDCYLPCVFGLETVPLSRVCGLDVAQTIAEEMPETKVVLLGNLEALSDRSWGSRVSGHYSIVSQDTAIPLSWQDLNKKMVVSNAPIFAKVEVKLKTSPTPRNASLWDKAIFFGSLGIAGGWFMTITIIFAPAGVFVISAGAITVLVGLAGKLIPKLWHKLFGERLS